MRPFSAVHYIRRAVAYEDFLREFAAFRKIPQEDLFDVLDELQEDARSYDTFDAWFGHIGEVKQDWEEQAARKEVTEPAVRLSTLHGSKGLEFDAVFILDVDERVMPYKKAVLEADLEEEAADVLCGNDEGQTPSVPVLDPPDPQQRDGSFAFPAGVSEPSAGNKAARPVLMKTNRAAALWPFIFQRKKNSYIWSNSSSSKIWSKPHR